MSAEAVKYGGRNPEGFNDSEGINGRFITTTTFLIQCYKIPHLYYICLSNVLSVFLTQ